MMASLTASPTAPPSELEEGKDHFQRVEQVKEGHCLPKEHKGARRSRHIFQRHRCLERHEWNLEQESHPNGRDQWKEFLFSTSELG